MIKPKDTFQRRFIAAESDTLVIETIQTIKKQGLSSKGTVPVSRLRILRLKGTWRANEYNEIVFEAKARRSSAKKPDIYTFKGSWRINKNQQIEYSCGEGPDVLTFKGYWNISSAHKLVYILEGSSTSRFEFRVQLESPSLYPKKGEIRYRIGIGTRKSRLSGGQLLILYGQWKLGRNLSLSFQMDYGHGRIKEIEFGAGVTFGRNKVILALENKSGEPLGITLTLTRKFLKSADAKAFVRLKSRREEQAIEGGISIPF